MNHTLGFQKVLFDLYTIALTVMPQSQSERFGEEKYPLPLMVFEPRIICSSSLVTILMT